MRGKFAKYKARLVVNCNGEDSFDDDSFAPVANVSMEKLVMHTFMHSGLEVEELDFDSAFLNGKFERAVYEEVPKRLSDRSGKKDRMVKLNRSLYRLKDAACTWNKLLFDKFEKTGLQDLRSAHVCFRKEML